MNSLDSSTLQEYTKTMSECIKLYYPDIEDRDLKQIIDYSINKRYHSDNISIINSYKNKSFDMTLLELADYINSRQPIVTGYGTMFSRHSTVLNPLAKTVQSFLDLRKIHKKEMFKYPRGSEMFEKYNLLQSLDKIDVNG